MYDLNVAKEYVENLRKGISLTRQEMRLVICSLYDALCELEKNNKAKPSKETEHE